MGFAEIIGSVLTGGLTGVIGSGITSYVEFKKQEQKFAHDLQIATLDNEMMKLEIAGKERVAVIEQETEELIADSKAFSESIAADRATYSQGMKSKWLVAVDVVRGLTRPTLTVVLCVLTATIWFTTDEKLQPDIKKQVAATVLYVTTAAVLWWFGSRVKAAK